MPLADAEGLLAADVPAVIATSQAIDDGVATEFAARFYNGLTGGAPLKTAFAEQAPVELVPAIGETFRDPSSPFGFRREHQRVAVSVAPSTFESQSCGNIGVLCSSRCLPLSELVA